MRNLSPLLKARFDIYFNGRQLTLTPQELLCETAASLIGTTAVDMDTINLIRGTVTKPWNEAWCDDFVQTCVAYVEVAKGILSPLPVSESVLQTWGKATSKRIVGEVGDMILWQLGTTLSGHCGIITGQDSIVYETIEGNTSDSAGIVRTGDGVFAKKRAKGGTKTFAQLGFIRCFP